MFFSRTNICDLSQMDALALDWRISMKQARAIVGPDRVLCGNVDPMVLYGTDEEIKRCVKQNIIDAGTKTYRLYLSSYSLYTIFLIIFRPFEPRPESRSWCGERYARRCCTSFRICSTRRNVTTTCRYGVPNLLRRFLEFCMMCS